MKALLGHGGIGDESCGVFNVIVSGTGVMLASSGEGWDHVSVSRPSRCPTWEEMSFVKRAHELQTMQIKLQRAQAYAAEVRARKPEMQVTRQVKREDDPGGAPLE